MNRALAIAAVILLGAATFQLGGAAPGATPLVVAGAALLALTAAVRAARRGGAGDRRVALVVLLASVPLLAGALELVPLPRRAVRALAPATARLYDRDDEAAGSEPGARSLSVEPGTSRRALERGVALVALFVLAASVARRTADGRSLALWLLGLGALVAVCGLGLSDTKPIADDFAGRARAPFKNPNHFATMLELLLPLALGIALGANDDTTRRAPPTLARLADRPDLVVRLLAVACVALFVAGIFRSESRAGVSAAAVGSLATIAGARAFSKGRLAVATGLLLAVSLGATWATTRDLGRLARTSETRESLAARVEYWRLGLRVLEGRALTGSGLGTYDATSFARLTSQTSSVLFLRPERAHNDYVNLASDLGVPAALAGVTAVLVALATIARRLRALRSEPRGLAAGALGGALAALCHAFFDFGLELAPIGAAFALVLGVGLGASAPVSEPSAERPGEVRRPARSRAALGAAALLLGVVLLLALVDLEAERRAASAGFDPPRLDAAKLEPAKLAAARLLAPDDALLAAAEAHARRARGLEGALAPARAGVRFAPASATTQGELALALLDEAGARPEVRAEGERRLALALELGPSWGALHFAAGWYWLDRTAATNDRAAAERAVRELRAAARLQLTDQPSARDAGERRVAELLRAGKLGALGEQMLRDLAGP